MYGKNNPSLFVIFWSYICPYLCKCNAKTKKVTMKLFNTSDIKATLTLPIKANYINQGAFAN